MEDKGTILIADDENLFLDSTADMLRDAGYQCDCASDSFIAREMMSQKSYDLLIADIKMPGNSNLEFISHLQKLPHKMPVILVTAYASLDTAIPAFKLPVVEYMKKPVDQGELISNVEKHIQQAKIRQFVDESHDRLNKWQEELQDIKQTLNTTDIARSDVSTDLFLALTTQNIISNLSSLKSLTEAYANPSEGKSVCQLLDCPRSKELLGALKDAIKVIEKTKRSFKSKELGDLKKRLVDVLEGEN